MTQKRVAAGQQEISASGTPAKGGTFKASTSAKHEGSLAPAPEAEFSPEYRHEVADTIRQQIGVGGLMTLAAQNLRHCAVRMAPDKPIQPGLTFEATVLPFNKNGERSESPRKMSVFVTLNAMDLYDVKVNYPQRGDRYGLKPRQVHFEREDVGAGDIQALMVALDYDGPEPVNPRFA